MPALEASSIVAGGFSMSHCSHITNNHSRRKIRDTPTDNKLPFPHNRNMSRRGVPKGPVNWFLREWMEACGLRGRGAQAKMMELTGWSKATMSQLFNGTQDYSPKVVNDAAKALNLQPYELLMHPDAANALKALRNDALRVVETAKGLSEAPSATRTGTDG